MRNLTGTILVIFCVILVVYALAYGMAYMVTTAECKRSGYEAHVDVLGRSYCIVGEDANGNPILEPLKSTEMEILEVTN